MKTWTGHYAERVKATRTILAQADTLLTTVRAFCPTRPVPDPDPGEHAPDPTTSPSVPSPEPACPAP